MIGAGNNGNRADEMGSYCSCPDERGWRLGHRAPVCDVQFAYCTFLDGAILRDCRINGSL